MRLARPSGLATPPRLSAWSLRSRLGWADLLLSPPAHPYLGVPIAVIEIESATLEACPELLVILGTRGREQKVRRQIWVPPRHPLLSQDLCPGCSLCLDSLSRDLHTVSFIACFGSLNKCCFFWEALPNHGRASGGPLFFEKGLKRTWMRWEIQSSL